MDNSLVTSFGHRIHGQLPIALSICLVVKLHRGRWVPRGGQDKIDAIDCGTSRRSVRWDIILRYSTADPEFLKKGGRGGRSPTLRHVQPLGTVSLLILKSLKSVFLAPGDCILK